MLDLYHPLLHRGICSRRFFVVPALQLWTLPLQPFALGHAL
jgi:hypothetical protein